MTPKAIRSEERAKCFCIITAIVGLVLLVWFEKSAAHDPLRPELDSWFMSLQNKHKVPCCDGSDALRLADVDWEVKDGHYRVHLDGRWVDVPDEAVIEQPNKDGRTLVWPYYKDGMQVPRCFIPGSMT